MKKKEENQKTMIKIESVLTVVRIDQHGKFQPIPPMPSQENAWKLQI